MNMTDFPFILFSLAVASGLVVLIDKIFFSKKRKPVPAGDIPKYPIIIDYARSLFPVFIIVLLLRSFVAQFYMVPTGSLEPTIHPGEFLFVTQYPYGLHFPVWNTRLLKTGNPHRGDIVVFHWPVNPKVDFIKRAVGVPGDTISYISKVLYINGKPASQTIVKEKKYGDLGDPRLSVKELKEDLAGVTHNIYQCSDQSTYCPPSAAQDFYNLIIPKGEYLMMGDNRDFSDDSRYWGLVKAKYLVGQAKYIVFSWNSGGSWYPFTKVRWHRIGTKIV